jgi:hypothetical protein
MNAKIKLGYLIPLIPTIFLIPRVEAHCPLCTVGIAAAAGGAAILGVKAQVIGLFVGALASSMGFWIANMKRFGVLPKFALAATSFLITVLPLTYVLPRSFPIYIYFAGDYGSLLNRTYLVNYFLSGSLVGAAMVVIGPWVSEKVVEFRNGKKVRFQGVIVTMSFLLVAGLLLQNWV